MASAVMHKRLIAAINLLGEYAEKNLPSGYEIILHFAKEEASMDLIDPIGFDVEVQSPDRGQSSFAEACLIAKEIEITASKSE